MAGPFVRRVRLQNYKSIARCDLELHPLTFLVGRNGSGKSNFLDALSFVADSLRTSLGHAMRFVELAARGAPGGAVLVLLDCDDGCPANLGPSLQDRASKVRPGLLIEVALARREFESWFVASAESLRGARGLSAELMPPPEAEAIRGAKEWLSKHMVSGRGYSPVIDQPAMTAMFDMDLAERRSDSFAACKRRIVRLLTALSRA